MSDDSEPHPVPRSVRILFGPLRVFFYLLYHQFAWTYDWVAAAVSLGLWQGWVLSIMPYLEGTPILELGYGPGHLQRAMWEKNGAASMICGLDASPQMGKIARRLLKRSEIAPNLINGKAQNLPFPGDTFHNVVATFPTEYIYQSNTMGEIYRVLMPGGRLVVLISAIITGQHQREQIAAWLFKVTGQSPSWETRLMKPARQAGFQVKVEEIKLKSSVLMVLTGYKNN